MIAMICSECHADMYVGRTLYYSAGVNSYKIVYVLIDENKHKSLIESSILTYNPDSAESRIIQYLIEYTQALERAPKNG